MILIALDALIIFPPVTEPISLSFSAFSFGRIASRNLIVRVIIGFGDSRVFNLLLQLLKLMLCGGDSTPRPDLLKLDDLRLAGLEAVNDGADQYGHVAADYYDYLEDLLGVALGCGLAGRLLLAEGGEY